MDIIYIRNLKLETLIGIFPDERSRKKVITINIQLFCDLRKAGVSDNLDDTIDYKSIEDKVVETITGNEYYLIERVAEIIAEICLATDGVQKVKVSVEKAGTMSNAESAVVEIERP